MKKVKLKHGPQSEHLKGMQNWLELWKLSASNYAQQ